MPLDLTIAIPTRNEEKNLPACLEAIGTDWAKRVVVVDSNSTDATPQIAHSKGLEVINFDWNGQFPKKRNWFLKEHPPATEWVLFLDADEFVTSAFIEETRRVLPETSHAGFWLRYSIWFFDRPLRGGYPLDKLALFRTKAGFYERIDEDHWSHLDMEVHEHPVLSGTLGHLTSPIEHRDFRGVAHWVEKHNAYSSWEAARFLKLQSQPELRAQWTARQKLKYRLMATPLLGPAYFLGSFALMGGWRDGATGLAFALLKLFYFAQIQWKIRENTLSATKTRSSP